MSATVLIYEPDHPSDTQIYAARIAREFPALKIIAAGNSAAAIAGARDASILVAKAQDITAPLIAAMPQLRWIQALTTGVDPLQALTLAPVVTITSARGIHGPQMAELTLLYMLSLYRNLPRMALNQRHAIWERWGQKLLIGKTVAIVGVGSISEAIAIRCKAFGLRVIGVTHRLKVDGFDELHTREHLHAVAGRADFLVLVAPYTPDTHHMIDASVLASMPTSGYLINIARGKVVDEIALIEALRAQRLAGAALDVFDTEPLPATSPLWSMENVIVTPHIGGMSDIYIDQVMPLLLHNLRAYLTNDHAALRNPVALSH